MINKKSANGSIVERVHTVVTQTSKEIQHFGTISRLPIALEASDYLLLALLYDTGARIEELLELTPRACRLDAPP